MLGRAVANRVTRSDSEVLPAITLDVDPTGGGLEVLTARLTEFARDHELPDSVGPRLVSVASDVADALTSALAAPALGRLRADADIGVDDAQLVLIAEDHRLPGVFASLRARLDGIASRCDGFAAELAPNAELQVWACFRLPDGAY
jgi:hypothetical protein